MYKNQKILDYIIYVFCLLYLGIDTISGFLAVRGIPNVGQPYKIILVLLMIFSMLPRKNNTLLIFSLLFYLSILILLYFNNSFINVKESFLVYFKILSVIFFYIYFSGNIHTKRIISIIYVNYIVLIVNILAGLFGFARSTYQFEGRNIGSRGFFIAGNEVAYTFLCLAVFIILTNKKHRYLLYLFNIILSILIATKACIGGMLLFVLIDVYLNINSKKMRFVFLIIFLLISAVCFILLSQYLVNSTLISHIIFKTKQHESGDYPLLNGLLSGRWSRLHQIEKIYSDKFSIKTLLFGLGFPAKINRIEMDFFEMYYYYGLISLFSVIIFYSYILHICKSKHLLSLYYFIYIILGISFLAGHVIYSVMGGLFFALINPTIIIEVNKANEIFFSKNCIK